MDSSEALAIGGFGIALRAMLGGGNETALTPLPPYSLPFDPTAYTPASSIVAADSTNSIAYARTTDQVLHIVYAAAPGAGVFQGGFFPNGLNGNIKVPWQPLKHSN